MVKPSIIGLLLAGSLGLATGARAQQGPALAPPLGGLTGGPSLGPAPLPPGSPYIGCMPAPPGASVALCDPPQLKPNAFAGEQEPAWFSTCHVSAGLMYLQPHFGNNPAYTLFSPTTMEQVDFSFNHRGGLFLEIGSVRDNDYGVRVNAWLFGDGAVAHAKNTNLNPPVIFASPTVLPGFNVVSPSTASILGTTGDTMTFSTHLDAEVVDVEFGRLVPGSVVNYLLTFGARYARLLENYAAFRVSDRDFSSLLYSHHFDGAGPTVLLELSRGFGDLGLNLYGNMRFSALLGRETQAAMLASTANGSLVFSSLALGHGEFIPNIEYEVGIIWQFDYLDVTPFVQGGLFGSTFFNAGTATSWDKELTLLGTKIAIGLRF